MHIKKLEIAGFKSFVEKTVIHFDHDVIGIVGPNGCGKSNIVDAIRWCMGEQSAKHLRGRAMEDVIFNGSDSRAAAGLAEVTLTFDNTDPHYAATLPLEYQGYPEIAVTRRLFRDGTSEYLVNKTQVRLRDITELFLGTGVGTKAYSIVEQGRIGQIVSARPEDRRLFIEEAAGITKYKQRRKQAERKMEQTRQNLARVSDIIREIERTSSSLQRQVQKAERYRAYRTELEDLVLHDASHQWLEHTVMGRVHADQFIDAGQKLEALRAQMEDSEESLRAARSQAAEIEERTEIASKAAFAADNEVSSLAAEIERTRDRIAHLDERLAAAERGQAEARAQAESLDQERDELEARLASLENDEESRREESENEDLALEHLRAEENHVQAEVDELRQNASAAQAEAAGLEARLDGVIVRRADAERRVEQIESERENIVSEIEILRVKCATLEQSAAEALAGKEMTQAERAELEAELNSLRTTRRELERDVDGSKSEVNFKKNRLKVLQDLHRRLEGVGQGARALIGSGDPAILGLVADRIEAPAELTIAFASWLGERLQYVVVESPEEGLRLLDDLKKSGRGRGHVIPKSPPFVAGARAVERRPGILGPLRDSLRYAPEDAGLVASLVGDAIVAETAEAALAFAREFPGSSLVALDGTVMRPEGTVSGGAGDDVAAAMVEQKREMHELTIETTRLQAELDEKVRALSALISRVTELETSLEQAKQRAHAGELAHVTMERDLKASRADLERLERRQEVLLIDAAELRTVLEESAETERVCMEQLDGLRVRVAEARAQAGDAEMRLAEWRERVAGQSALVTERKVRLAQVKEQTEAVRKTLERMIGQKVDLMTRSERLALEAVEVAKSIGESAAKVLLAREARLGAVERSRQTHEELQTVRAELETVRSALQQREGEMRESRVLHAELDDAAREAQMALQRVEMNLEHILTSVREKFRGLDLRRVVGDYHKRPAPDADLKKRIEELHQAIDRIGPVNLDAEREYQEAETRYRDLNNQKVDIEQALDELDKAIKHMDRESKTRFKETFETVNELFKKTFVRNFRGGRAELRLTDPDDLLASGVDIMAQPPGKKLGNIELMSGGEKALTAVSLIFAIFQHRPSPFCVLDEVDAPLDEANVSRYNEAIRSMTANSQFILITHIRKTMQSVDVLYGVTMGEPGVSRLVSVKVNDGATSRSEALQASRGDVIGADGAGAQVA